MLRLCRTFCRLWIAGLFLAASTAFAAEPAPAPPPPTPPPRILLVTAHPDDDALFSGAVYKTTHALGGTVDLAVVTNGEGGYRFSTLAEPIYGLKLTDEAVGRAYLPSIRKRELMAGGAIVGIRNYFFLDQLDSAYSLDMAKIFAGEWDVEWVKKRLGEVLAKGRYDFVFVLMPTLATHAGHRASAILALEAVNARPATERPIVLGGTARVKDRPDEAPFTGLDDYPLTRIRPNSPAFEFDRTQKFGLDNRLGLADHRQLGHRRAQVPGHHAAPREPRHPRALPLLRPQPGSRPLQDPSLLRPPRRGPAPGLAAIEMRPSNSRCAPPRTSPTISLPRQSVPPRRRSSGVEQLIRNQQVVGSNPTVGSK